MAQLTVQVERFQYQDALDRKTYFTETREYIVPQCPTCRRSMEYDSLKRAVFTFRCPVHGEHHVFVQMELLKVAGE